MRLFRNLMIKYRCKKLRHNNMIAHLLNSFAVYDLWTGKYYFLMNEWDIINYDEIWLHMGLRYVIRGSIILVY